VIARTAPEWRSYAVDLRGHGRSARTPGRYRLEDYVDDADRLLEVIGEPAVVVGHSLGSIVAASLAQDRHPLVAAVFLEDPPLYLVEPGVFADSALARGFAVLRDHIQRLQHDGAPVETYRDLLAASPHPGGGRLGDHLHDDALWSRAGARPDRPRRHRRRARRDHVRRLRPGPAAAPPRPGRTGRPGA
jgi:pimeloyl-ACP methyl ester carboxylesterase